MNSNPGQQIVIPALPNLRDLGGWPTRDSGRVRRRLVYRSVELNRLHGVDLATFARLGIRTVYDLRTEAERTAEPDRVPEGTEQVVVDVLADAEGAAPAELLQLLSDPKQAKARLGDGKAEALFEHAYRELVSLPSALSGFRLLFTQLAQADHRPALIHCTTGKDRTGWASAALLLLLGVADELVMRDYLLTNEQLLPALKPIFDRFHAAGGDPELLTPVLGVQEGYLRASLDEMRSRFETIEGYFADGLGIHTAAQRALHAAFVEEDV